MVFARSKDMICEHEAKRILMGTGKNPLIVLHVRTNDIARFPLKWINDTYIRLGKIVKEREAQVIFSGILLVPREGRQRVTR